MWDRVNARSGGGVGAAAGRRIGNGHVVGGMTTPPKMASDII